jgi:hypothetical protein
MLGKGQVDPRKHWSHSLKGLFLQACYAGSGDKMPVTWRIWGHPCMVRAIDSGETPIERKKILYSIGSLMVRPLSSF